MVVFVKKKRKNQTLNNILYQTNINFKTSVKKGSKGTEHSITQKIKILITNLITIIRKNWRIVIFT